MEQKLSILSVKWPFLIFWPKLWNRLSNLQGTKASQIVACDELAKIDFANLFLKIQDGCHN